MTEGTGTSRCSRHRLGLSRIALAHSDELERALERACEDRAQLGVERVGVCFFPLNGRASRARLCQLGAALHSSGATLPSPRCGLLEPARARAFFRKRAADVQAR